MNKIVFTKLFVDGSEITRHELGDAVNDVVRAQHLTFTWHQARPTADAGTAGAVPKGPDASSLVPEDEAAWPDLTSADLLALALAGQGSSRTALVGDTGIEPVTSPV